jgi:hypothetical protein
MDIISHIQSVHLDEFVDRHPNLTDLRLKYTPDPLPVGDPLLVVCSESAYNEHAFAYVCQVAGKVGESAPYRYRHLVASQVLAAASIEEGGFAGREFLDPHSSLRLWMVECAVEWAKRSAPEVAFAHEAAIRMGDAYVWRGDAPEVGDPFAAMLGAHFASEYLAAQQEFPLLVETFQKQYPEFFDHLRSSEESHFHFSAADWIEGHPAVEKKHAGFAARAAEAAVWESEDGEGFWKSFETGYEQFCKNDQRYFSELAEALK